MVPSSWYMPIAYVTQYPYISDTNPLPWPITIVFRLLDIEPWAHPDFKPGPFDQEVNYNSNLEEDWLCESHVHRTLCVHYSEELVVLEDWQPRKLLTSGVVSSLWFPVIWQLAVVILAWADISSCVVIYLQERQNLSITVHTSSSCNYWIGTKTSIAISSHVLLILLFQLL